MRNRERENERETEENLGPIEFNATQETLRSLYSLIIFFFAERRICMKIIINVIYWFSDAKYLPSDNPATRKLDYFLSYPDWLSSIAVYSGLFFAVQCFLLAFNNQTKKINYYCVSLKFDCSSAFGLLRHLFANYYFSIDKLLRNYYQDLLKTKLIMTKRNKHWSKRYTLWETRSWAALKYVHEHAYMCFRKIDALSTFPRPSRSRKTNQQTSYEKIK